MTYCGRLPLPAAVLAPALALAAPAAAPAATAAVTGDDGAAVPLTGPVTVHTMTPQVLVALEPEDQAYAVVVEGPGGTLVGGGHECRPRSQAAPVPVAYAGNGSYTVQLRAWGDATCGPARSTVVGTFSIAAFAAITPPSSPLLTRPPLSPRLVRHPVTVQMSAGAATAEVQYALDQPPSPDGSLGEVAEVVRVDPASGRAMVTFQRPGTYTLVSRARLGAAASPWSAPAAVRVQSPFDFTGEPAFSDDRGPKYRIQGVVRETTATGTIAVAIRRARGKRFRRLGSVRIRRAGRFAVAFRLRGSGRYQLRYRFAGSETTAPGEVLQGFRVARGSR